MLRATGRAAALGILLCVGVPSRAAEPPAGLPPEAARALQQLDVAGNQLEQARSAAAAVEAGQAPSVAPPSFAALTAAFQSAAEALRKAPSMAGEAVPRPVAARQLKDCGTRAAALNRVERQLRELGGAAQRGAETAVFLKGRRDAMRAAEESRRRLAASAEKSSPATFAEVFAWKRGDAEALAGAMTLCGAELKRHAERVERSNGELRQRIAQLTDLHEEYGGVGDCVLAGSWLGGRSRGGSVVGMSLELKGSPGTWSGVARLDNGSVKVRSVSTRGNSVTIVLADEQGSLHGALAADGRTLGGTFQAPDGPASFQLHKQ